MKISENLESDLTVIDSTATGGEITVVDRETDEVGTVISQSEDDKLLVQWQDSDVSDYHEEFELISLFAPNVKLLVEREEEEFEYVENPFGGWLSGKVKDGLKLRKVGKSYKKRLKAEKALKKAQDNEKTSVEEYQKNPNRERISFAED